MMDFFISDVHMFHNEIIHYDRRPFTNMDHMREVIGQRWNERVKRVDRVFCLGDMAFTWGEDEGPKVQTWLESLNGQKFLIRGNHDRATVRKLKHWAWVDSAREVKVKLSSGETQRIMLSHYAHRSWPARTKGTWHLYGHSHGGLWDAGGKMMDVGVMCHGWAPISLTEVEAYMAKRPIRDYSWPRQLAVNWYRRWQRYYKVQHI